MVTAMIVNFGSLGELARGYSTECQMNKAGLKRKCRTIANGPASLKNLTRRPYLQFSMSAIDAVTPESE